MLRVISNQRTGDAFNENDLWEQLTTTPNHVHTEIECRDREYKVEVFFKNSNGSSIFAKARDVDRLTAMVKCIEEIERLW